MTTPQDILLSSSRAEVNQRSLSRAHEVWQQSGTASFALLMSARADLDSTANAKRSRRLQALVREMGYGEFPLVLHVDGTVGRVLFVFGIPLRLAERLRQQFEQGWFLFSGEETACEVWRYSADGQVEHLGTFDPARIATDLPTLLGFAPIPSSTR